ncbi:MAG: flippase-like domain-containing protein, partial [Chloroflexaceae bacterium]|nr:flippase-like domain-containing protein [Chloroflexaceae bacterium]
WESRGIGATIIFTSTAITLVMAVHAGTGRGALAPGTEWSELARVVDDVAAGPSGVSGAGASAAQCLVLLRALRWRVLLSAEKAISPLTMFWATSAGYLGNTFLPARAGEIIRSALIGRREAISTSYVLATALTERMMDVIILVLMSGIALMALPNMPEWLVLAAQAMAVMGIVALGILFLGPRLESFFTLVLQRIPLLPPNIRERLISLLSQFLMGMRALHHPGRMLRFAGWSLLIWSADAVIAMLARTH